MLRKDDFEKLSYVIPTCCRDVLSTPAESQGFQGCISKGLRKVHAVEALNGHNMIGTNLLPGKDYPPETST